MLLAESEGFKPPIPRKDYIAFICGTFLSCLLWRNVADVHNV